MGGFPSSSIGEEFVCNAGDLGSIPGSGRIPWRREWHMFQYSCLENSWTQDLVGYSPWDHKELDTTVRLTFFFFRRVTILSLMHVASLPFSEVCTQYFIVSLLVPHSWMILTSTKLLSHKRHEHCQSPKPVRFAGFSSLALFLAPVIPDHLILLGLPWLLMICFG